MTALINAVAWHVWRLLTFRPVIEGMPRSPQIAFAIVAVSTPLVLAGQGPLIAVFHTGLLAFLIIKFQVFQIVSALAVISITINTASIATSLAFPDQPAIGETLHLYETVLWIFTGYRWLHPKPNS